MAKTKYRFGMKYMDTCRVGIAVTQGERYFWLTDGYTKWLITDFDPAIGPSSMRLKVWVQ
jgi:hypothetical protein